MEWVIAVVVIWLLFKLTGSGGERSHWQELPKHLEPPPEPPVTPEQKQRYSN